MVYVLNKNGRPLMPCSSRKARMLLSAGKATVAKRTPFVIRLLHGSSGYVQPVTMGVDSGFTHVGISVVTGTKEIYAADVELRRDLSI
jgi:N6-L-threonylcarbamoyladenine synthase